MYVPPKNRIPFSKFVKNLKFDHIKKPLTFSEIVEEYEGGEYNAELLLQHLLFQYLKLKLENAELKLNLVTFEPVAKCLDESLKKMEKYKEAVKGISIGEY